jgi:hypothetical protein
VAECCQDSTKQRRGGQHSAGQHSTAQHSTAQHSTAQHLLTLSLSLGTGLGPLSARGLRSRRGMEARS